jgi:alpha-N-arabinofuranosidase
MLTAPDMDARNSFDAPNAVRPVPIRAERQGDALVIHLPPKSMAVVAVQ